ncbi:MAG: SDR family oxidoreductase [Chloroflexi bacterium]|nr:SDR family oxidoreductase [Chloroflexota bacterium]
MGGLDGKIAIVTGGRSGIGKGIARGLAREGASVVITSRGADELEQTARELSAGGATVVAIPGDMTKEADVDRLFATTMDRFGRLDILVNNAGAFGSAPIDEMALDQWDTVIGAALTATFLCSRSAMRIMKPQGGGRIINVASISAKRVRANNAAYNAAKHGVWGLTQTIALEGRDYGISASCLNPGNTLVERIERQGGLNSSEPMMTVDELAQTAVWMALLPPHMTMLEADVIPIKQAYVGRG